MRNWLFSLALLAAAQPAMAQQRFSLAISPTFQGYKFADDAPTQSASLMLVPIGIQFKASNALTFDLYSAYARGTAELLSGASHTMEGIVDTRLRANVAVTSWAVITAALNLPTGNATHDDSEAIVASVLSGELLGFREALWGTGFGATTGIATAFRAGSTGIGLGASYRVASEFEPDADQDFKYTPGNEVRVRAAIDQDIGNSKLTLGGTFQNYSDDRLDGRDLFAPGNRWRADVTYSFRAGTNSTWTLFATDIWRENGDVTLEFDDGTTSRDSVFEAGQQNLVVVGLAGSLGSIRPSADVRLLTREIGTNEGWLGGLGFDFPMRRGSTDIIPTVRGSYGQLEDSADNKRNVMGGEVSLTIRFGGAR
jgi:hypothetical protein